jgi:hypothetical protein
MSGAISPLPLIPSQHTEWQRFGETAAYIFKLTQKMEAASSCETSAHFGRLQSIISQKIIVLVPPKDAGHCHYFLLYSSESMTSQLYIVSCYITSPTDMVSWQPVNELVKDKNFIFGIRTLFHLTSFASHLAVC